jgi:hypothetical protein
LGLKRVIFIDWKMANATFNLIQNFGNKKILCQKFDTLSHEIRQI